MGSWPLSANQTTKFLLGTDKVQKKNFCKQGRVAADGHPSEELLLSEGGEENHKHACM